MAAPAISKAAADMPQFGSSAGFTPLPSPNTLRLEAAEHYAPAASAGGDLAEVFLHLQRKKTSLNLNI